MKGKTLSTLGIFIAIAGAVLIICFHNITKTGVVVAGGILFVAVGLINLIIFGQSRKADHGMGSVMAQISNAAAIVLGICMLVFESTFSPLVPFIFGLLVAVCSLWEFFLLALGTRPYQLPSWLYLFPIALAGGAVYIFLQKNAAEHLIMLVTGISLAVLGVACIIEGIALGVARRRDIKAKQEQQKQQLQQQQPNSEQANKPTAAVEEATPSRPEKSDSETTDDLDDPAESPQN